MYGLRWFFEDRKTGRIVIAQMPNVAMWVVLGALLLSFVVPTGRILVAIKIVLFGALCVWSVDEIIRGVNPWRRTLGIATLLGTIVWLVIRMR